MACHQPLDRPAGSTDRTTYHENATLLLVDDDHQVLEAMAGWLRELGYDLETASSVRAAIEAIDRKAFDLVLADIRLQDGDGFEILDHCRRNRPSTSVIMITGFGSADAAVEAIRAGAFDFLTKPLIDEELQMAIERALAQRQVIEENTNLKAQLDMRFGMENIVGHDHRMQRIFDVIETVADTKATVLITGESGTGKSLIARAIHRRSGRRDKPFVEVACGALPEALLESELFGHVAGAFTGAVGDKLGKFVLADGGTIFLDEIATASPAMQVKLLRVLQDLQFEPVGGVKTFQVDTRVILATNEDLPQAVAEGRIRQDLFYRINVINIALPSLHERISDIPLLANYFLAQTCDDCGRSYATASATKQWPQCSATAGPATSANSRTWSNGPSCSARTKPLAWKTCHPRSSARRRVHPDGSRLTVPEGGSRRPRATDHSRGPRVEQLESQRHGRFSWHQPHDPLQEDETAWP